MNNDDLIHITFFVVNIGIGALLYMARLERRTIAQENRDALLTGIDEHNSDPDAHANHSRVSDLQEKFDAMISKMGELTTQLAVLNERMKTKAESGRRR